MKFDLVRIWKAEPDLRSPSTEEQLPLDTNTIELADEALAEVFGAIEGDGGRGGFGGNGGFGGGNGGFGGRGGGFGGFGYYDRSRHHHHYRYHHHHHS